MRTHRPRPLNYLIVRFSRYSFLFFTQYLVPSKSYIPLDLDRIYIIPLNLSQSLFAPLYYVALKIIIIKMANDLKSHALTISIITLVRKQLTVIQEAFTDALA